MPRKPTQKPITLQLAADSVTFTELRGELPGNGRIPLRGLGCCRASRRTIYAPAGERNERGPESSRSYAVEFGGATFPHLLTRCRGRRRPVPSSNSIKPN